MARFAENATAETTAKLLKTTVNMPGLVTAPFQRKWRLCEMDANPANLKCERLISQSDAMQDWRCVGGTCAAHRVHAIATKTFKLSGQTANVISGCTRSLLTLQAPGALVRWRTALLDEILGTLRVTTTILSPAAEVWAGQDNHIECASSRTCACTRDSPPSLPLAIEWRLAQVRPCDPHLQGLLRFASRDTLTHSEYSTQILESFALQGLHKRAMEKLGSCSPSCGSVEWRTPAIQASFSQSLHNHGDRPL